MRLFIYLYIVKSYLCMPEKWNNEDKYRESLNELITRIYTDVSEISMQIYSITTLKILREKSLDKTKELAREVTRLLSLIEFFKRKL